MEQKLERLEIIKEKMLNAPDEELLLCIDRISDILLFVNSMTCDNFDAITEDKLKELKDKNDFIYYKSIELVFLNNDTKQSLIEILTNLLSNSLNVSQQITVDYITVLAFSSFSDGLRAEGYVDNLANYLISHFRMDFLIGYWNKINTKLEKFFRKEIEKHV